jgi:predicted tellurium resistance membrane protein TerC
MHFLLSALSIVLIDLLLAGDNALIIAMAVRSLPPRERRIGIVGGAGAAVLLRIALTTVAARLLTLEYLQIAGASKGNFWLIAFGLTLSIPFVVFSSNLLANLMDRYSSAMFSPYRSEGTWHDRNPLAQPPTDCDRPTTDEPN